MRNLAVAKCRSSVSASGIARSAMTAKLTASVNENSWSAYRSGSPPTAPPDPWAPPTGFLALGEIPVVCPRDVVPWSAPPRSVGKANDLEGGVLIRVEHFAFQRLEPLAQYT